LLLSPVYLSNPQSLYQLARFQSNPFHLDPFPLESIQLEPFLRHQLVASEKELELEQPAAKVHGGQWVRTGAR